MNYTQESMLGYLFNNIPEYKQYHTNALKWWSQDNNPKNLGLEAMTLLGFTKNEIARDRIKHLKLIFDLIEDMLSSDNDDAQFAAYMMFLEGLFNSSTHEDTKVPYDSWHHLLGPKSREAIAEMKSSS